MTTLSNWLVGCSTFALIVTSLTFAAESNVVPATLCKASDPSISFDIKSRERGLENVSQINSLNVTCPLPIQMTSSGSTKSNELINVTLFASVNSSDSLIPQCHLTYQTGLRTELILEPSVEDSEGSTEFIWNDIPFGDDVSGYIISCLLTPQSIIETIRISTFANQNDQDLTLGHYCAGAFNPIEFGEEATSFRYLGNDIPLTGKPSGTNFILSGLLNDTPVIANFNLKSDNQSGTLRLEVGSLTRNGWLTKGECTRIDLTKTDIEKIASSNIISVSQLDDISLFRSSAGHDASDDFENCRSMKHYLEPTQKSNQINSVYAPVSGTIVSMDTEEGGGFVDDNLTNQRVGIKSSSNSAYEITLYHVDLLPELNLALGDEVTAGELLGHGRLVRVNSDDPDGTIADASNDFDISVGIATMEGTANVSFFNIVSDNVFNEFFEWHANIVARDSLIISKSERDTNPLSCNGEQFTNADEDPLPRWISEL